VIINTPITFTYNIAYCTEPNRTEKLDYNGLIYNRIEIGQSVLPWTIMPLIAIPWATGIGAEIGGRGPCPQNLFGNFGGHDK